MAFRWVVLNLAGQRVGEILLATSKPAAYAQGCALHGAACHQVQSLLSWEAAQEDLSAVARQRRIRIGDE